MKNLTNLAILLCLASVTITLNSCASDTSLSSRESSDPFPWCADQRREAAEHLPAMTGATLEKQENRDRYMSAQVDQACRQASSPTHP